MRERRSMCLPFWEVVGAGLQTNVQTLSAQAPATVIY